MWFCTRGNLVPRIEIVGGSLNVCHQRVVDNLFNYLFGSYLGKLYSNLIVSILSLFSVVTEYYFHRFNGRMIPGQEPDLEKNTKREI